MNTKTKIKCKYTLQRHSHIHLPHQHICSIEGELFGKYLTTDSSDPSARIGRSIVRTYTSKHTSSYLLPLCSHWFFPTQYCTAPACSADCTSRTERGEGRRGGGEGGGGTDAAVALLFSTLFIKKAHDEEDENQAWGGFEGHWGVWLWVSGLQLEEGYSINLIQNVNHSW